jgi:hypothetical protein
VVVVVEEGGAAAGLTGGGGGVRKKATRGDAVIAGHGPPSYRCVGGPLRQELLLFDGVPARIGNVVPPPWAAPRNGPR